MTATDELRRMLDERGVEWKEGSPNKTKWSRDGIEYVAVNAWPRNGGFKKRLILHANVTPEQAIAATLGVGTCELHDCEGSFSAVNKPVWRCDCGAFMTQYTDATTYHKPRFCPNCGRKVAE